MNPRDLLSTADIAAACSVSESTVRHWRQRGEGPIGFLVGRRVRYYRFELDAWLDLQRATSGIGAPLTVIRGGRASA